MIMYAKEGDVICFVSPMEPECKIYVNVAMITIEDDEPIYHVYIVGYGNINQDRIPHRYVLGIYSNTWNNPDIKLETNENKVIFEL